MSTFYPLKLVEAAIEKAAVGPGCLYYLYIHDKEVKCSPEKDVPKIALILGKFNYQTLMVGFSRYQWNWLCNALTGLHKDCFI